MKITGLSLDSQLAILNQLPGGALLGTVPLVNTQWSQLQPFACRQRRALTLMIQKNHWKPQQPKIYPTIPFNAPYAVALCATFPRITHLVLDHWDVSIEELDQQLHLLQNWTSTLVSLQLTNTHLRYTAQENPHFNAFFNRLLVLLNQMPRLKQLRLRIVGPESPTADLSPLRRLVSIKLHFEHFGAHLVSQLQQHCSSNLQRLSLGTVHNFTDLVPLLTSPAISSKLEHLTISDHLDATQLSITFDQCTNLRSLELSLSTLDLYTERLHRLTKLPHLTELSLVLKKFRLTPNDPEHLVPPPPPTFPLPVFSSIHQLTITIESVFLFLLPSHEHLVQATQLDKVFPHLQQIWLHWPSIFCRCQHCVLNRHQRNRCITAILRPLAHLETLQVAKVRIRPGSNFSDWLPRLRRAVKSLKT